MSTSNLKILITNDDGYLAQGINALAQALDEIAQVEIVAPEQNSSGMSSCLTVKRPLQAYTVREGVRFINGTPADCVYVALNGLLDYKPDLVVSGVNDGANLGDDTIYSGTVAAAIMAHKLGVPALAFSQVHRGWKHLETTTRLACEMVTELLSKKIIGPQRDAQAPTCLLNINVPDVAYSALKGRSITRLGRRQMSNPIVREKNPYGDEIFWLGMYGEVTDASEGTDFYAIAQQCVSVTPLRDDLADIAALEQWKRML